MSTCGECGAKIDGSSFCTSCGATAPNTEPAAVVHNESIVGAPPIEAIPPAPDNADQKRHSRALAAIAIATSVLVLGALVGGAIVFSRGSDSTPAAHLSKPSSIAVPRDSGSPVVPPSPSKVEGTTPAPIPRTPPTLSSGEAVEFIDNLYSTWTARGTAEIEQMVDPQYWGAFDPDFLDRIGVGTVASYGNSETLGGTTSRVCGYQRFYRDDGMSQEESRCFVVESTLSGLRVVWTGDQRTLDSWRVT
jgi:hypothetical protein